MNHRERSKAEDQFFQGTRFMESGDAISAEACYRKAIQIAPDFAEAYANLGLLLDRRHDTEAAELFYRRSIEINSGYSETHLNLGALLASKKRFNEAELFYLQAIAIDPELPSGWSNLGVLYACMKREEEAEQCYRTAITLDESYATARFNLSYLLLRQGRFEEGWYCLGSRHWNSRLASHFLCPLWKGESLKGKSIVIGYEAGHGDMIQFCRYASVLKAKGTKSITMICHPALKTLFATLESVDEVISLEEQIPASGWDFWTPLLSIPCYCETRFDSIPAEIPYLHASPSLAQQWAQQLPRKGLNVGLVWKGNPLFENDADRSIQSLDVLLALGSVSGVNLVSLQKSAIEDEIIQTPTGLNLIKLASQITDFADTAAIVTNLDLVICVDTAVAHLTGALGKPCWVLLPDYKTDWRWLKDREDSPWYPEVMRLFRQTRMGDWTDVVAAVVCALEQFVHERSKKYSPFPS